LDVPSDVGAIRVSRFLLEACMNRVFIDEAKILIDGAYAALDRVKDPKEIEAIREMLKEADALLSQAISRCT
jgi:hypothetical protein